MRIETVIKILLVAAAIWCFGCAKQTTMNDQNQNMNQTGNPIIRHKFTSDPTALVFGDTVYLYTGHDEAVIGEDEYVMNDWLCFSSKDMVNWTEHPTPLKSSDFAWSKGKAYAAKVIERGGKFYFYAPVAHNTIGGAAIGVAVADSPVGPFRDARGTALITNETINSTDEKANLDPTVLIDDDGQAYIFWGSKICYFAKLKENMIELDGAIQTIKLPEFQEGAHLHKKGGWYYLSYGYQMPEKFAYAMSRNINGPWEFKGIVNETAENSETNRGAIIEFKGKSYFFYHNGILPTGGDHRRSVCADELEYNADGTMRKVVMTRKGVSAMEAASNEK